MSKSIEKISLVLIIVAILALVGCTSTPKVIIPANFQETADPMAVNLITGLDNQDFTSFSRDFDDVMIKAIPEEAFLELRKMVWNQFGNYQSIKFKKVLEEKGHIIAIYTLTFEKDAIDMRLVFQPQSPYRISGLWFPPK